MTPNECRRHLQHKNTRAVELLGKPRNDLDHKDRSVIASRVDPHSSVLDGALFIVQVLTPWRTGQEEGSYPWSHQSMVQLPGASHPTRYLAKKA